MDASTVPSKSDYLGFSEVLERRRRLRASILTHDEGSHLHRNDCTDFETFKQMIKDSNKADKDRLIILEDLSSSVIEFLGSRFDIDPRFFRSHLEDHTWYNVKDTWIELSELESAAAMHSFFSLRYVQARWFDSSASLESAKQQAGQFNVLRRIDAEGQAKQGSGAWYGPSDCQVGLIRHRATMWIRPQKYKSEEKEPWLG